MLPGNFSFEIKRKIFHLASIIFPVLYLFLSKGLMIQLLFIITLFTLYLDIFRHYNPKIKELTSKIFTKIMRTHEKGGSFKLSGASFMALGFFITACFFPQVLTIVAWLVLIMADSAASLIGSRFGTTLTNGKSLAGSAAFFICTVIIGIGYYYYLGYDTNFIVIIASAVITTIAEFYSKSLKIDDNLLIPIAYAGSAQLVGMFF